jgi:ArsR family transcriptional regulator, arsenate/arsenite/antimonite-responsive transcriptional repressor
MKPEQVVQALGALAQESRLAMFRLLVKRGPDGYTPGELQEKLAIAAATLSFHLKELQRAGLLTMRRDGRFLYYSADFPAMNELLGYLTENCCSLSSRACDASCVPVKATVKKRKSV